MVEWGKYAVRAAAAAVLMMAAISMLIAAAAVEDSRAMLFGFTAVLALAGFFAWPRRPNAWRNDKPTQRQLEYAASLGINVPKRATKGEVSDMISAVTGR
jgi:hypothetical protein